MYERSYVYLNITLSITIYFLRNLDYINRISSVFCKTFLAWKNNKIIQKQSPVGWQQRTTSTRHLPEEQHHQPPARTLHPDGKLVRLEGFPFEQHLHRVLPLVGGLELRQGQSHLLRFGVSLDFRAIVIPQFPFALVEANHRHRCALDGQTKAHVGA